MDANQRTARSNQCLLAEEVVGESYLSQSDVRFLNEVLQTATEGSGQQQIGRLP